MCDRDCFHCQYEDCLADNVSPKEIESQTNLDKQILFERKSKKEKMDCMRQMRYNVSDHGREVRRIYAASDKAKEIKRLYEQSDKGKEYARERAKRYRERKRIMMTVYEIMRSIDYRPEGRNYET